jgi:AraC-like DNA-binding protein/mannose-6-phosphate isomerase-like protein (cupin superfamily)
MLRKKEGFDGQRAIVLPRKILTTYCSTNPLIAGAYITDIGYYPKAKYHYRERVHGSDQHILIYCQEGKGTVQIKKEEYELSPGEFIIVPLGFAHTYAADATTPWTIYWAHFKGDITNKAIDIFRSKNDSYKGFIDYQDSRIRLFEDMYFNLEMGYSNDNLCYINLCFLHFLSSFLYSNNYNLADKKQSVDTINLSISFMQKHIDVMLTLQDLAKSVNLSTSHFSFLFRKKTGFSPIEYFNHLKVQKACQYLLFTDLRIKEIADKLGIEDQYYFSRMFSKLMGTSPGTYRSKRIN